ncbi:LLM class flavin-dependent oxidoreductase [Compostibacter hankyongensis]|uniref:LLM class flavin-dependent oxidoreductase n=1 Tax=Compostibacter hankyongensis TaxID=1007089 RepID=A0ABP8FGY4_9BACT
MKKIKLSILDQSPVRKGSTAEEALRESARLVKLADRLGYTRYWVSEHHNIPGLAGSAPEVLIPYLASQTRHIRVGSGGIMLPNHSALKVAENFRLLEALFPGRIDLGMGRAPGGDRLTALLLNPSNNFDEKAFLQQLADLSGFLYDDRAAGALHEKVKAIPRAATVPELWLLTSSGESALFAAHMGMGLSFAQFINPSGGPAALQLYRERFRPSRQFPEPVVSVGIFAGCADTEEKAAELQAVMDYRLLNIEKGNRDATPSYEEIKHIEYTEPELARIYFNRKRMVFGTPEQVKQQIQCLADSFDADEFVIATITDDFGDRLRSYELLAEAFDITPTFAPAEIP